MGGNGGSELAPQQNVASSEPSTADPATATEHSSSNAKYSSSGPKPAPGRGDEDAKAQRVRARACASHPCADREGLGGCVQCARGRGRHLAQRETARARACPLVLCRPTARSLLRSDRQTRQGRDFRAGTRAVVSDRAARARAGNLALLHVRRRQGADLIVTRSLGRWRSETRFPLSDVRAAQLYKPPPGALMFPSTTGEQIRIEFHRSPRSIHVASGLNVDREELEAIREMIVSSS